MAHSTIRFFFDFISPYSYLAWKQIHALAERTGMRIEPVPVLFAAFLNAYGQKGPAEIPPKRLYMFKELFRRAHRLDLPLVPPPSHPFLPLLSLRVASLPMTDHDRKRLIDSLFAEAWGGGSGIESPENVTAVANRLGLDGHQLVRDAGLPASKDRLREQTEGALKTGVFGVPTMIVGQELFWGADSLEDLEAYIRGDDPLQHAGMELFARWQNMLPSAKRH